jgi:hypothetical protein
MFYIYKVVQPSSQNISSIKRNNMKKRNHMAGRVAQVVESLPIKCEMLSSNPVPPKENKRNHMPIYFSSPLSHL